MLLLEEVGGKAGLSWLMLVWQEGEELLSSSWVELLVLPANVKEKTDKWYHVMDRSIQAISP